VSYNTEMKTELPKVGIGVIIVNKSGQILMMKRSGSHAAKYSIPGGNLETGETFESAAKREIEEETSLKITAPQVIAITNNLETYREEGKHYISIILLAKKFTGTPKIMEPTKCTNLFWCDPRKLPQPHFDASRLAVECYLKNRFYRGISR